MYHGEGEVNDGKNLAHERENGIIRIMGRIIRGYHKGGKWIMRGKIGLQLLQTEFGLKFGLQSACHMNETAGYQLVT